MWRSECGVRSGIPIFAAAASNHPRLALRFRKICPLGEVKMWAHSSRPLQAGSKSSMTWRGTLMVRGLPFFGGDGDLTSSKHAPASS